MSTTLIAIVFFGFLILNRRKRHAFWLTVVETVVFLVVVSLLDWLFG